MKINVSKLIGTRATLKLPISTYQVQVSLKGAEFAGTKVSMWVQLRVVAMLANEADCHQYSYNRVCKSITNALYIHQAPF